MPTEDAQCVFAEAPAGLCTPPRDEAAGEACTVAASLGTLTAADLLDSRTAVRFSMAAPQLAQSHEWQNGRYVAITWPNILPPDWACKLTLQQALDSLSASARLPEFCINEW